MTPPGGSEIFVRGAVEGRRPRSIIAPALPAVMILVFLEELAFHLIIRRSRFPFDYHIGDRPKTCRRDDQHDDGLGLALAVWKSRRSTRP